jgi:glyoxylase I family protein
VTGKDVQRSLAFYTQTLGFKLNMQHLRSFGQVPIGDLKLILSGPGASSSRLMPDGRQQEPGGWNSVVLHVKDLPARIAELKNQGVRFRNELQTGLVISRFRSKIRTAIVLNFLSQPRDKASRPYLT